MKRRDFLKMGAPLGVVPLLTNGLPIKSLAASSPFFFNPCNVTDRSVVLIYLSGGNDIFNTTVPLDQFSDYVYHRPDIYIPQNQLITLDNTLPTQQQIGLHPMLSGMKQLYDDGIMKIVQGVGHNNPNKSHFKALDNWLTGSGGGHNSTDGWIGRFLDNRYPSYNGAPFLGELDPLGLLFDGMNKTGFHTHEEHSHEIAMSGRDSQGFYSVISSIAGDPIPNIPSTDHGGMLNYIESVANSLNVYAQRVQTTFANGTNSSNVTYPNTKLGDQLKTIARLLNGGSRTKVFMARTGGFDTHVNQVDVGSAATGAHAGLMNNLSTAIKAFQDDLKDLILDDKVLTIVFSEFGRKIIQNGSHGVDHGTLNSMFFVGTAVDSGVIGNNVDLNNQDNPGAPNPNQTQYDYRQVFSTVLQDWLGADDNSVNQAFPDNLAYPSMKLPIINTANIVPANCYYSPQAQVSNASMQVQVLLEGFYNTTTDEMSTAVASAPSFPVAQPYSGAPFNYAGTETISTLPQDTVDWVLLELREAEDFSQVVARQAALVRKDGALMQPDGSPGIAFNNVPTGDYHLAVFHRNHLGVISSLPVALDSSNYIYDFTSESSKAYGKQQQVAVGSKYAMIAGDLNGDQIINNEDYNFYQLNINQGVGYNAADINADGNVDTQDYQKWFGNRSKLGELK